MHSPIILHQLLYSQVVLSACVYRSSGFWVDLLFLKPCWPGFILFFVLGTGQIFLATVSIIFFVKYVTGLKSFIGIYFFTSMVLRSFSYPRIYSLDLSLVLHSLPFYLSLQEFHQIQLCLSLIVIYLRLCVFIIIKSDIFTFHNYCQSFSYNRSEFTFLFQVFCHFLCHLQNHFFFRFSVSTLIS